jgi:hypothetical protein
VKELIDQEKENGRINVLDPFAGSGTVLIEAELANLNAMGLESHPFIARIAKAKLFWKESPDNFLSFANGVLQRAKKRKNTEPKFAPLIHKCYPPAILSHLDSLKRSWLAQNDGSAGAELAWLVITSILRECSPVGTAQWQYIQPRKSKARVERPYDAFEAKVSQMYHDMLQMQILPIHRKAKLFQEDAREIISVPDRWADLVITSPPYANNFDYADATRLEMTFWGEVSGWGDLQQKVRKYLIRACTQQVGELNGFGEELLSSPLLTPIHSELKVVFSELVKERLKHGGKKAYHLMIVAYFKDMAQMFVSLRRVTKRDSLLCFVIGDSAPYGIYVPVERWLGQLAVRAGFKSFTFEKLRDRNIKWKNRKHKVPLHEGRLWIKG